LGNFYTSIFLPVQEHALFWVFQGFKCGLVLLFWTFKPSFDVGNMAFFGLAAILATFQKIWLIFSNLLVTLVCP
jgi:hypothetical protein